MLLILIANLNSYDRDDEKFKTAYPNWRKGFTHLIEAVRKARQARGESKRRVSKKKLPA